MRLRFRRPRLGGDGSGSDQTPANVGGGSDPGSSKRRVYLGVKSSHFLLARLVLVAAAVASAAVVCLSNPEGKNQCISVIETIVELALKA